MSAGNGLDIMNSVLGAPDIKAQQVSLTWTRWNTARSGIMAR